MKAYNIKIGNHATGIVSPIVLEEYTLELLDMIEQSDWSTGNVCIRRREILSDCLGYNVYISACKCKAGIAGMIFTKKDIKNIPDENYKQYIFSILELYDYSHVSLN